MPFVKRFEEISAGDGALVGGKNASLGEMIQNLDGLGILVPSGFAVTAEAYHAHLKSNGIKDEVFALLNGLEQGDLAELERVGQKVRDLISGVPLPDDVAQEVSGAYAQLEERYSENVSVALRSSATAEDLPNASFAGQQETFLHISGVEDVLAFCPKTFASLYTNRAISYRFDHDFSQTKLALSIGVQKMVRSDLASAGVAFTLDTESGHPGVVFINGSFGLGENVVKGTVNPDEFYVHKDRLAEGFPALLKRRKGSKQIKMLCANPGVSPQTYNVDVPVDEQKKYCLTDEEVTELARHSIGIEKHYSILHGKLMPMDIEWAKDGEDGKLYIVQARPETVHSQKDNTLAIKEYRFDPKSQRNTATTLAVGKSVGSGIVTGVARLIASPEQMNQVGEGDIVVATITDPDWEPIMKKAAGIITDQGGRTCHAAIVSRELGIPAIVGTNDGTAKIAGGQEITLDCSTGEVGTVFDGHLTFSVEEIVLGDLPESPVGVMVNVGSPDSAFKAALLPSDGVGLCRMEFIISSSIKVHPMALLHPEQTDDKVRAYISEITSDVSDNATFFVDTLTRELATVAGAFWPRPIIVRFSDFKSNEYAGLVGGSFFEPNEENPMLGLRGASRYNHEMYKKAFALECQAIKRVREVLGFDNVKVMIPFLRTVDEAQKTLALLDGYNLKKGDNSLEVYMMCEVPSNVILMEQFALLFDGVSIGSNDLTQFTLGLDRDSALVASLFDERNEAVKTMISMAIEKAHAAGVTISICGQGPSDYPEFAQFLIDAGIDTISLSPDAVLKFRQTCGP